MDSKTLYRNHFQNGTPGYTLIRNFYIRYADLLRYASLIDLDDIVHEVYASISRTDFTKVRNREHYIMRAIKLHCWSLIDKSSRMKQHRGASQIPEAQINGTDDTWMTSGAEADPVESLQERELLVHINLFKEAIRPAEAQILNHLIDMTPREEIARSLNLNLNTLDTQIRRLRIKLVRYLSPMGYSHPSFHRFVKEAR